MKRGDKVIVTIRGEEINGTIETVGFTYDGTHLIKTDGRAIVAATENIKESK